MFAKLSNRMNEKDCLNFHQGNFQSVSALIGLIASDRRGAGNYEPGMA